MIRLTGADNGKQIHVSPEHIIAIGNDSYSGETAVVVGESLHYVVKESPEEVARKVLEYKLAIVKFTTLAQAWGMAEETNSSGFKLNDYAMDSWEGKLLELAGLEVEHG